MNGCITKDDDIFALGWSRRARNRLRWFFSLKEGRTIGDLMAIDRAELLGVQGLGAGTMQEIDENLAPFR